MKKVKMCDLCQNPFETSLSGEWICDNCKHKEPVICANCGKREATQNWVGEGGALAWSHGMTQRWCEICCLYEQIKFAKEQAKRIPELEKKLNDLMVEDLKENLE